MRVLLIEDNVATARGVELILCGDGCSVDTAALGEDGIALAKSREYDIVILDLLLPDMNGFKVLTALRAAKVNTPVLVLSGDANLDSRVATLRTGADDYMTKPFHKAELVARVRAIARRSVTRSQSVITAGKIVLNLDEKTARVGGVKVNLTIKEYQMLEALALRKGMTLSKDALLHQLYGDADAPEVKIIDVFICKLRKKLAQVMNGENYIRTIWGQGYQFSEPLPQDLPEHSPRIAA